MKFFSKNKSEKSSKLRNAAALRQGGFSVAITAVVIAVIVVINVLFGVLADRVNLDLDISLKGNNTLDEQNIEFIKNVDTDVVITVCCEESAFIDYSAYVAEQFYGAYDETGNSDGVYDYFEQTLTLLDLYDVYSDKITVRFVNPNDTSFSSLRQEHSNIDICDILVEANHTINGETAVRSQLLSFDDIYYMTQEESSYYGSSMSIISGNQLETALTSAIYKVTSAESKQALVLGTHCTEETLTQYMSYLEMNNFDTEVFSGDFLNELSEEVDLLLISQPVEDFAAEELDIIDEWLYNGGLRSKGIMFFASPSSPYLPNLYAYLEEWGVSVGEGVLYETDEQYNVFNLGATTNQFSSLERADLSGETKEEYKDIMEKNGRMIASDNVPLYQLFDTEGIRAVDAVAVTPSDTVVIKPLDAGDDWKPDGSYDQSQYPGLLIASEADYVDNVLYTSYVAVFSSPTFAAYEWLSYYPQNADSMLVSARMLSGAEDDGISFDMKKNEEATFSGVIDYYDFKTVEVIFQWIIPIALVVIGIVVFVRRKRR